MARLIQQLTEAKIRTLAKVGLHHDGSGLCLQVRPGGARSWIYRYRLNNRTRDIGLGALADVSLVKARSKASAARALVNDGIDAIEFAGRIIAGRKILKWSAAIAARLLSPSSSPKTSRKELR